ncbi:glycosyltransferase family 2 protein [Clostridium botulinum]|uniref:glycosyltransferase family 2 protein n=1 Tax=Clostridium botulinum TaxID=1491 RepID=UPI001C9ADB77|nr:glycosyltransferase family 2 protein [Clostridium botulinum]MBY6839006.1 glycosyltransferase family 2 protein [Clostridium botulinum]
MEVSFIIPIYNTEESLLLRCFNSILNLRDIKYEVLLIDDGSQNFVEQFCKQFSITHPTFHYFKKNNEGVSEARNYGINKAIGKYIFFIDSDDSIVPECFNEPLMNNKFDIIIFDLALSNKFKSVVWKSFEHNSREVESKEAILDMMYSGCLNSPCSKLIKRDLIIKNKIYFDKNLITGEDADFILNIFLLAPSIYYVNKVIYHYFRTNESSRKRMLSNPEKLVENYEYHKFKKMKILDQLEIDCNSKKNAKIALISTEIKNIFNLVLELQQEGLFSDSLEKKIIQAIKHIEISILMECKFSTKLRYYIIHKKKWKIMIGIQSIRRIYLTFRGLHI